MVARQIPESEIPEGCRFKSDSLQFFCYFLTFSHCNLFNGKARCSRFHHLSGFQRRLLYSCAASRGV